MSDIDTVAEAIFNADPSGYEGEKWKWLVDDLQNGYRRMAQAAIDALQLTEETHNLIDPAWHIWQERIVGVERRLVSPWVRVEEQP